MNGNVLPEPVRIPDAVLGPLVAPSRIEAVACRADTGAAKLAHLRAPYSAEAVDVLEVHPVTGDRRDMPHVAGPALYAGPYFDHFGHMAAEGVHRLWAASLFPHLRSATIVFQRAAQDHGRPMPPWCIDLLALCGIAAERVLLVDRETRFAGLHVPRQGRALGGAILLPGYVDLFPLAPLDRPEGAASGLIYLSRSSHLHMGSYLGESLIEAILAEAGFDILDPGLIPTRALVGRLAAARVIVAAEGSAIHNLELCGPVAAKLFVIGRRIGTKRRFGALLESLCAEWRIFPASEPGISLGWEADAPRQASSCAFLDLGALVDALAAFAGMALRRPDAAAIRQAVSRDLARYVADPRSGAGTPEAARAKAYEALRADPRVRATGLAL